jgi:hypothetical protein
MIPASVYADQNRLKKIIFLTGALDSALAMMNVDAFSPSATTIAAIEDLYRKRIEIRSALSRIA